MLQRICMFVFCVVSAGAGAATVVEQALPASWVNSPTAYCSPCSVMAGARMFASFDLDASAVLDGARLAAANNSLGSLGDFTVSVWSSPLDSGGPLFQTLVRKSDYTLFQGSGGYLDVGLPEWRLEPGHYWLSILGAGGDAFQWGGILNEGDDRRYSNGAPTLVSGSAEPRKYLLGFSLYGSEPVETPIGGTLPMLLAGLGLISVLRRRRGL